MMTPARLWRIFEEVRVLVYGGRVLPWSKVRRDDPIREVYIHAAATINIEFRQARRAKKRPAWMDSAHVVAHVVNLDPDENSRPRRD